MLKAVRFQHRYFAAWDSIEVESIDQNMKQYISYILWYDSLLITSLQKAQTFRVQFYDKVSFKKNPYLFEIEKVVYVMIGLFIDADELRTNHQSKQT